MQRRPLLAGNWKMYTTLTEAKALAEAIVAASSDVSDRDVMIAPPYTALAQVAAVLRGSSVLLASQNICWEEQGAFTGEISPVMLKELGGSLAIIGHSERRHVFGETNEIINNRIKGALRFDIIPVFCVGETLGDRESGKTMAVLEEQVNEGLRGVDLTGPEKLVLAYEPVWAIGTGKTATVDQAQEAHVFLRQMLAALFEKNIASHMRILYGGSVNPENVDALMAQDDIDGVLVGGASLKADSFDRIIHFQ